MPPTERLEKDIVIAEAEEVSPTKRAIRSISAHCARYKDPELNYADSVIARTRAIEETLAYVAEMPAANIQNGQRLAKMVLEIL